MSQLNRQSLELLKQVYQADYFRLKKRFFNIEKLNDPQKKQTQFEQWLSQVETSIQFKQQRAVNLPQPEYPDLPVSAKREDIIAAIKNNQVVIVAGETGSGKTTQLPKMCLEAGCGLNGFIGHTQPRRLAARSVANRIAEELKTPMGEQVGYKVRFNDHTKAQTYIKLMTDGILLAEIQQDRFLNQYDTIIIDEAHERSLNIDFILGYLKQLLPKRPDLKVIITSATIDVERFSKHFNNAPVFEVSGRTYPVEIRYQPLTNDNSDNDNEDDQMDAIAKAVKSLTKEGLGDILIFMNGEREIRDTADSLNALNLRDTEVLPLYARLSNAEQNRIFQSHTGRRIVLATNVAETSLTVPGIRYVIDPGTARISRYSARTKVQRLPIEAISQASANQRAGRCGRVAAGICIRLYSEEDYLGRPEFTDPEILRTNLASVILQMHALGLGDIAAFPFVQPPDNRNINDGILLLQEIGALEQTKKKSHAKLTQVGRSVSRLPVDPRLGKMVFTANELSCLAELIVIVAGLSIQDPRERPNDKKQAADEKHKRFDDEASDFLGYLKLWQYIEEIQQSESQNQLRKRCKKEFLNYLRIREWQDVVYQLTESIKELGWKINQQQADFKTIHQALISGLLSHIGNKDNKQGYNGARNTKFVVFPGSALSKTKAKWIMAAELVETSRLFARTVAKIEADWIEPFATHLVNKNYTEPHWEKKRGSVVAYESQVLYGLTIVHKRKVQYGKIDPVISREIFIREALVNGDVILNEKFLKHNQSLIEEIEKLEAKARRRDILADEEELFAFYDKKLPANIIDLASFKYWWKQQKQQQGDYLTLKQSDLMQHDAEQITQMQFPDTWRQGNLTLPLEYVFEPSQAVDGINVVVPLALLNQVEATGFDWSVPGYRHELAVALIKSLPKNIRKNFVPAPDYASAALQAIGNNDGDFIARLSHQLKRMSGVIIDDDAWDLAQVPSHLKINYKVVDVNGKVLANGKDLEQIKQKLQNKVAETLTEVAEDGIERVGLTDWDFDELAKEYSTHQSQYEIKAYPALADDKDSVSIKLFDTQAQADWSMLRGLTRLIYLNVPSPRSYLQEKLPNKAKLGLYFNAFGQVKELIEDCIEAAIQDYLLALDELPRNKSGYLAAKDALRADVAERVLAIAKQVERILTLSNQINKKLKGKSSFELIQAQSDIKNQMNELIFKGFVSRFGVKKLADIERYMQGIERRLEKLAVDPVRDRLNRDQIQKLTESVSGELEKLKHAGPHNPIAEQIRWMIEELRMSLFAQNLGTAYPISTKRISQFIEQSKKEGSIS
ncbi:ATP-dependent RNA helicase HrpA [Catenovulum sp. 2E275]|uniref:ATP-dependent RNA helicase HrpA n=1 Tax=Catenovulum sp. 2E275 TaxID=2980497 RepID=UPI0021D15254|nr:ATP-dependent RNA helicase HrpA [Catenovulum sp. 2E275]MCU4674664.1 ATP-dependent RNA helicase HrpA [Catenovulum sp. 2E275]